MKRNLSRILTFFLLISLLINSKAIAQINSGYFGAKHGVELRFGGVPTIERNNYIGEIDGIKILKERLELLRPTFKLNYSYIAGRKIELIAGYEFANMRTPDNIGYDNAFLSGGENPLLQDIVLKKHGANVLIRFYRKGSLAPTGKYFGLGMNFMGVSIPDSMNVYSGVKVSRLGASNILSRKYTVGEYYESVIYKNSTKKYTGFTITAAIGRNYPINERLLLNFNLRIKIIGIYKDGLMREIGDAKYSLPAYFKSPSYNNYYYPVNSKDDYIKSSAVFTTMNLYNRAQFEIGLKYYL